MKKLILLLTAFLFISSECLSVTPDWIFVKGANVEATPGIYGVQGVADASLNPGARMAAVTWTDAAGNLWLFGGFGYGTGAMSGYLNDLWKFNPSTNQWTWMKGTSLTDQTGSYGTPGVAAAANCPGGRSYAAAWNDNNGNLWLFGGEGVSAVNMGILNDLWKYNITLNQWTWMGGSNAENQTGLYGTIAVASLTNCPGSRRPAAWWNDNSGNLWLMGGFGNGLTPAQDYMNDLWRYNISSGAWTWMKGSQNYNQAGNYGVLGAGTGSTTPGAREGAMMWSDGNSLYLFGGTPDFVAFFNDLWRYDITLNQWVWLSGSNSLNQPGTYGTLGTAAASNVPGARQFGVTWKVNNELWLCSGLGFDGVDDGILSDVWKYNTTTNMWTWIKGPNTINQYGTYGVVNVAAPANTPGGRNNAVSWHSNNTLWLFGGYGNAVATQGQLSDLWKIACIAPAAPDNATQPASQQICSGNTTSLFASSSFSVSWYASPTSTSVLGTGSLYTTPSLTASGATQTYTYYAQATSCTVSPRTPITVTVNPAPTISVTTSHSVLCYPGGSGTLTASGAASYTWNQGGPAASMVVSPSVTTSYTVTGTSAAGCTATAAITQYVTGCIGINEHQNLASQVGVYPNPAVDYFNISIPENSRPSIRIYNAIGELIYSENECGVKTKIDLRSQPKGVYYIVLSFQGETVSKRVIRL